MDALCPVTTDAMIARIKGIYTSLEAEFCHKEA